MVVAALFFANLFLKLFVQTEQPALKSFRESQIEFFASIGFEFTWIRIILMSIAAGVSEELLFRGVLQVACYTIMPVTGAIILTNIVFGLLHIRTVLYAVIAGTVGIYLGVLYAVTCNLFVVIICHGVYDVIAFAYTRSAIIKNHRISDK